MLMGLARDWAALGLSTGYNIEIGGMGTDPDFSRRYASAVPRELPPSSLKLGAERVETDSDFIKRVFLVFPPEFGIHSNWKRIRMFSGTMCLRLFRSFRLQHWNWVRGGWRPIPICSSMMLSQFLRSFGFTTNEAMEMKPVWIKYIFSLKCCLIYSVNSTRNNVV